MYWLRYSTFFLVACGKQLAGAYYGLSGLPKASVAALTQGEMIVEFADKLYKHAAQF